MQKKKEAVLIETKDLAHEYGRRDENGDVTGIVRAIDGISLTVRAGDFVTVLGANGSGKSTFARHLNALLHPTEGVVYVDGIDTSEEEMTLAVRQTAGMVFQNPDNQIISNVVEEDVAFGPENMGVPSLEIKKRVAESLAQVGMQKYRHHSPNHLSGGQKQRIAIAGIMAMHPKCIVLDEATAMLDPAGRRQVLETLHRLNREEGITILLITHYMEEAAEADAVYVLKQGKIALAGRPETVFGESDKIKDCGLALPDVSRIVQKLNNAGLPIDKRILTPEKLTEALGRLAAE